MFLTKPPHMPWISNYLIVKDVEAARKFYIDAFGFSKTDEVSYDDNGRLIHAAIKYHDIIFMIGAEGAYGKELVTPNTSGVPCPVTLYVYCEDVDVFYAHALKHGAKSTLDPTDTFWGDRMCQVTDLDGYHWSFAKWSGKTI